MVLREKKRMTSAPIISAASNTNSTALKGKAISKAKLYKKPVEIESYLIPVGSSKNFNSFCFSQERQSCYIRGSACKN